MEIVFIRIGIEVERVTDILDIIFFTPECPLIVDYFSRFYCCVLLLIHDKSFCYKFDSISKYNLRNYFCYSAVVHLISFFLLFLHFIKFRIKNRLLYYIRFILKFIHVLKRWLFILPQITLILP